MPSTAGIAELHRENAHLADCPGTVTAHLDTVTTAYDTLKAGSVPVTTIEVKDAAVEPIPESERVLVGENVTCRLAQERASYRVLRYVLPVVKRRDTGELVSARAPANVLDRTTADVSLLAGMLVDKLRHRP